MVDYKTDVVDSDTHLQALTAFYTPQLQTYDKLLQRHSSITVRDKGLWFAGPCKWLPVG
jgi:ATP-dependent exoDNAse (exonuclease V) beta subunit